MDKNNQGFKRYGFRKEIRVFQRDMASVGKIRVRVFDSQELPKQKKFYLFSLCRKASPSENFIHRAYERKQKTQIQQKCSPFLFLGSSLPKIASSPLYFLLHVTTRRYPCMKKNPVCIFSLVACTHMTFTLVPHKVSFSCKASTFNYGPYTIRRDRPVDPRPILDVLNCSKQFRATHPQQSIQAVQPYTSVQTIWHKSP